MTILHKIYYVGMGIGYVVMGIGIGFCFIFVGRLIQDYFLSKSWKKGIKKLKGGKR